MVPGRACKRGEMFGWPQTFDATPAGVCALTQKSAANEVFAAIGTLRGEPRLLFFGVAMPSFNFAVTTGSAVPLSEPLDKHQLAKLAVQRNKQRADALLTGPRLVKKTRRVLYGTLPQQIRLIASSNPMGLICAPYIGTHLMHVRLLSACYRRLNASGFEIFNVTTIRLEHAEALIDMWQQDGCTSAEFYFQWTALLAWTRMLGKPEMLDPLREVVRKLTKGIAQQETTSLSADAHSLNVTGSNHV